MGHIPAMLEESLEGFRGKRLKTFFEGTLGAGGFAKALLTEHSEIETYFACDRDASAIKLAKETLGPLQEKVVFIHGNFSDLDTHLEAHNINEIDGFFLILGYHLCS